MDTEDLDLSCPCMPQCPNYGKCRICIASHAKFYTAPHCVKMMLEDMKKNHKHAVNPHMRKSLPERIAEYYQKNPGAHIRAAATELKITQWQLLDAYENAIEVPVTEFSTIYEQLASLDKIRLHADTGSVLIQVETKLPTLLEMHGTKLLKNGDSGIQLTSILFEESFYALFLVRESLYGKESLSLAIVDEDEKISLSIYLSHDDEKMIEKSSKALFEKLWNQYKK